MMAVRLRIKFTELLKKKRKETNRYFAISGRKTTTGSMRPKEKRM